MENRIEKNHVIGRGRLYFDKFKPNSLKGEGERYLGNTPELSMTADVENLAHYNSDSQIKEKDMSVVIQVDRTGSFTTDQISSENLALFFFGDADVFTQVGADDEEYTIDKALPGLTYQIGQTKENPAGVTNLKEVDVTADGLSLVAGEDYVVELDIGRINILKTGKIPAEGVNLTLTISSFDVTRERVISGNKPIEGSLRFIADNPIGKQHDHYWPRVSIAPNGDYALKGDDWQTIPFVFEVMSYPGQKQHYVFDRGVVKVDDDNGGVVGP